MYESGLQEEFEKISENSKLVKKQIQKMKKDPLPNLPKKVLDERRKIKRKNNSKEARINKEEINDS